MKDLKFTKGEWVINKHSATTVEVMGSNRSVASTGGYQTNSENSESVFYENIANAKLIAASPNLLKQLIIMTSLCKIKYGNLDEDVWREIIKSEEAINKATK